MRKCGCRNLAASHGCQLTNHSTKATHKPRLLTNRRAGMVLSEERHAGQLVVGGGASLVATMCFGLLPGVCGNSSGHDGRKTNHRYPGCWSTLGMTCLLVTLLSSCQPVVGIEANISPPSATIKVGSDLTIACILTNQRTDGAEVSTSRDIVWYKNHTLLPVEEYLIIDDSASSISLHNVSLADAAMYFCALRGEDDRTEFKGCNVLVGYEAQAATSLFCYSHDMYNYTCEWIPVPTHIPESHTLQFRPSYGGEWSDCPKYLSPTKCYVDLNHNLGSNQQIQVVSTNVLGRAVRTIYFNPDRETVPLPPSHLTVTSQSSTILLAQWKLPPDWSTWLKSSLQYRLRWCSEFDSDNWQTIELSSELYWEIQNLEPYTRYQVQIAATHTLNGMGIWGEWSPAAEERTDESAPSGTVSNLETESLNSTDAYFRDVLIYWEPPAEREQRGIILGYEVDVEPHTDCRYTETIHDYSNETDIIFEGLEQFCSYTVKVRANNSAGYGPDKEATILDMTGTPFPPSDIEAKALSHQSVLVNWTEPFPVQGYIQRYTVRWIKAKGQDGGHDIEVPATNLSLVVEGLEGYVLYNFKVSVTNKNGNGAWSLEAQATTKEWIPAAAPTNLTASPIPNDPNALSLDWIAVREEDAHGEILGHYVYYKHCFSADGSLPDSDPSVNNSDCTAKEERQSFPIDAQKPVKLTGVSPFSRYLVWISAYTGQGEGPRNDRPAVGQTSEGAPSEPLGVAVTSFSATSIGLTWSPPLDKNGIIRNHTVLVKSNTSSMQQEFYAGGGQSYVVEGLYGHVHYSLQVQACTATCGPASEEVHQRTDIGVPEQPESLSILSISWKTVKLSWEPPSHPNGPISYYRITYHSLPEQLASNTNANAYTRSMASTITTLANIVEDGITTVNTTDHEVTLELDCSSVPNDGAQFLFRVSAVNVVDGKHLMIGQAAETEYTECIQPQDTTLSLLLWLILPGGIILLFALLTSLHYIQGRLGKSWPDPKFSDVVTGKQPMDLMPRTRQIEKEEFDTVKIVEPRGDLDEVIVAEEYPVQTYHCPVIDVYPSQSGVGSKEVFMRSTSVDSGVPPSPQDHLDFSGPEDVFDSDSDSIGWSYDTLGIQNAKVTYSRSGSKGGRPKRSVSLSSSDGCGPIHLQAIDENGPLKSMAEKLVSGAVASDVCGVGMTRACIEDHPLSKEDEESGYSRIPHVSILEKQVHLVESGQTGLSTSKGLDDLKGDNAAGRKDITSVMSDFRSSPDGPSSESIADSDYVSKDMMYNEMSLWANTETEETSFQLARSLPGVEDPYVPGPLTYSILASPQVPQSPQVPHQPLTPGLIFSDGYVSKDSLAYSKLAVASEARQDEIISDHMAPFVSAGDLAYAKLGAAEDSPDEEHQEESRDSSSQAQLTTQLADYVRGADLFKSSLDEAASPSSPVCIPSTSLVYPSEDCSLKHHPLASIELKPIHQDDPGETTPDTVTKAGERELEGRLRKESSSSSSGYISDSGVLLGDSYMSVSSKPKEHVSQYANLAFSSSSDSETDSDLDANSGKCKDSHATIKKGMHICSSEEIEQKSKKRETCFLEYVSTDEKEFIFVNDCPDPCRTEDEKLRLPDDRTGNSRSPEKKGCGIESSDILKKVMDDAEPKHLINNLAREDSSIYDVPNKFVGKKEGNITWKPEGDDGYVPFDGDSGYVMRYEDGCQGCRESEKGEYLLMSPIRKKPDPFFKL